MKALVEAAAAAARGNREVEEELVEIWGEVVVGSSAAAGAWGQDRRGSSWAHLGH